MPATAVATKPATNGNSHHGATSIAAARFHKQFNAPRRSTSLDDLERFRLTWYPKVMTDLEWTLKTKRAVEYRASVATMRYLQMAQRRLNGHLTLHMRTNPHTDIVSCWLEKK